MAATETVTEQITELPATLINTLNDENWRWLEHQLVEGISPEQASNIEHYQQLEKDIEEAGGWEALLKRSS